MLCVHHSPPRDPHSPRTHPFRLQAGTFPHPEAKRFLMNEPGSELQIPGADGFPSGYPMLSPQWKQCVASGGLGPPRLPLASQPGLLSASRPLLLTPTLRHPTSPASCLTTLVSSPLSHDFSLNSPFKAPSTSSHSTCGPSLTWEASLTCRPSCTRQPQGARGGTWIQPQGPRAGSHSLHTLTQCSVRLWASYSPSLGLFPGT